MLFATAKAGQRTPVSRDENRRFPLSTEGSPRGTEVDPQLSACAQDDPPPERLLKTSAAERQRNATGAQADVSPSTVRLAVSQLLGGRYRIERELGEGGMGIVYLATDEQVPGEKFAIKVLKKEPAPGALAQLREEVRKTRKLSHPNIVDVHSVNVDGERLYVLMEYLEGKSLQTLLDEEFGRGMAFSRAWPIIEDVGTALGNAHDHNVIHSDLKPANVFVTTSGRSKLLDFGIARVSRGPLLHARSGSRALTPAYASCEMLEGKEADRRDDIYSFGCVIYEMLCGERPFRECTALEAREGGTKVAPLDGLSRGQNVALAQALSFEREKRTASVEKLLNGLAAERPTRSRAAAVIGGTVTALVAAAGLTYLALEKLSAPRHSVVVEGASSGAQQAAPVATVPTTGASNPSLQSIAVLPFVNMSADPKQEYFSDGLSEELIDHLVQGTELKVIARTSSFQFRGKNEDARSIARTLGVTHLLEGSVRKDGRQLRIAAQLVRGWDGVQIWSQTYDRNLVDIFKVQNEIAEEVAQALRVALRSGHPAMNREPDVRAYNLVLEGNYFKARRTLADVEKATQLYQQAIEINPDYALAWARLASAYFVEENLRGRSEEQSRRVLDALNRAIQLDPNLAWAYYTRAGFQGSIAWNWTAAKADTERVRKLDPRFGYLPGALGDIALVFGDVSSAVELYRDGLTRNPLDPNMLNSLGVALCAANLLQECLQARLSLMQLHPEFGGVSRSVGAARLYLGQFAAALNATQSEPNEDYRLHGLAVIYWAMGRRAEADAALNSLTAKSASIDPYGIASIHAYRGEIDQAFQWLDRAYRAHDYGMLDLKTDPLLRNLHRDPRFQELLHRMRLNGDGQPERGNIQSQRRQVVTSLLCMR
ncbi:MAG: protein kinase [Steroidobacteraceae bacterium]